jgi:hypothetical protein
MGVFDGLGMNVASVGRPIVVGNSAGMEEVGGKVAATWEEAGFGAQEARNRMIIG